MKTTLLLKDRVYQLRKEARLSQQQLGEILGLSHKSISMIESGGRGTTVDKLALLAEYFHVSTDYLLGLTDDPSRRDDPPEEILTVFRSLRPEFQACALEQLRSLKKLQDGR